MVAVRIRQAADTRPAVPRYRGLEQGTGMAQRPCGRPLLDHRAAAVALRPGFVAAGPKPAGDLRRAWKLARARVSRARCARTDSFGSCLTAFDFLLPHRELPLRVKSTRPGLPAPGSIPPAQSLRARGNGRV